MIENSLFSTGFYCLLIPLIGIIVRWIKGPTHYDKLLSLAAFYTWTLLFLLALSLHWQTGALIDSILILSLISSVSLVLSSIILSKQKKESPSIKEKVATKKPIKKPRKKQKKEKVISKKPSKKPPPPTPLPAQKRRNRLRRKHTSQRLP